MPKLIVAGCSVSDYTQVDKVWGEYLAEKLRYEYLHEAAGCGSNYRIWRVLASHIRNNNITSNDTVIVQYTTLERNEFWSPIEINNSPIDMRDEYNSGSIIRFKSHSHTWNSGNERKLMKIYERFISLEFEEERFHNNHIMIQCLMKEYGIKNLYFLKVGNYGLDNLLLLDQYKDKFINCQDIFNNSNNHLPGDIYHFSDVGHKLLADIMFNKINDRNS